MSDIDDTREEEVQEESHRTAVRRDRAYARRLDERQIRERTIELFDKFIQMGFTAHMIAVQVRGAVEYRIALYPDGTDAIASDDLAAIAEQFNFDLQIEKDPTYEQGWIVVMYPLT